MQSTDPGAVIRPWQAVLLALALASLATFVLIPVLLICWAAAAFAITGLALTPTADLLGTDRFLLGGGVHLAVGMLLLLFVSAGAPNFGVAYSSRREAIPHSYRGGALPGCGRSPPSGSSTWCFCPPATGWASRCPRGCSREGFWRPAR